MQQRRPGRLRMRLRSSRRGGRTPHDRRREEQIAVLGRGWKLIDHVRSEKFELYDLAADPGETNDLSGSTDPDAIFLAGILSRELEVFRRRGRAESREAVLSDEEMERLRSLGYLK